MQERISLFKYRDMGFLDSFVGAQSAGPPSSDGSQPPVHLNNSDVWGRAIGGYARHPSQLATDFGNDLKDDIDNSPLGDITDILKAIPLFLVVGGGLFLVNELVSLV
jgi:hypothetical protein